MLILYRILNQIKTAEDIYCARYSFNLSKNFFESEGQGIVDLVRAFFGRKEIKSVLACVTRERDKREGDKGEYSQLFQLYFIYR